MTGLWIVMAPVAVVMLYLIGIVAVTLMALMAYEYWPKILNALEGVEPLDAPRPIKLKRRKSASKLLPMEQERRWFQIWRRA